MAVTNHALAKAIEPVAILEPRSTSSLRLKTSRIPSVLIPTAIIAATDTMRPTFRTFTYVASIQMYGQSPVD